MTKPLRSLLSFSLLILISLPALAAERVAQIRTVTGDVNIEREADGSTDSVTQRGPRVRNGSVFGGDQVVAGRDGHAVVIFGDGSEVEVQANSRVAINEVDLAALVASGDRERPVGRSIRILAGDVLARVVPNPKVATEFRTPSGVAAVKGTILEIKNVTASSASVDTTKGLVSYADDGTGIAVELEGGQGASFSGDTESEVEFRSADNRTVRLAIPGRGTFYAKSGSRFSARADGFAIQLSVLDGLLGGPGLAFRPGQTVGWANPSFGLSRANSAAVRTEEGEVVFTNPTQGARVTLETGYGISVTQNPTGSISLETPADNPGPLAVDFGGNNASLDPGSEVEAAATGSDIEIDVEEGTAVVTDQDGQTTAVEAGQSTGSGRSAAVTTGTAVGNSEEIEYEDAGAPIGAGDSIGFANPSFTLSGADSMSLSTTEGSVQFTNEEQGAQMTVNEGFEVSVIQNPDGKVAIATPPDNPGALTVSFGESSADLDPGADVEAAVSGSGVSIAVEQGLVKLTDGGGESQYVNQGETGSSRGAVITTGGGGGSSSEETSTIEYEEEAGEPIEAGDEIGYANPSFTLSGADSMTLSTEEGSVQFTNEEHGATTEVTEGFEVTMTETIGGTIEIETPDDNPGALDVDFGENTVTVDPGSEVEAAASTTNVDVDVAEGTVTVTDSEGNEETVNEGESSSTSETADETEDETKSSEEEEKSEDEGETEEEEDSKNAEDEDTTTEDDETETETEEEPAAPMCGDGNCDSGENCNNCPGDCPAQQCIGCEVPDGNCGCRTLDAECDKCGRKNEKCLPGGLCTEGDPETSPFEPCEE